MKASRAIVILAIACGPITGSPQSGPPVNSCAQSACGAYRQMPMAACNGDVCEYASNFAYTLVVSLPDSSPYAPNFTFVIASSDLFTRSTKPECNTSNRCVALPGVVTVSGQYTAKDVQTQMEVGYNLNNASPTTLPAKVTFRPLVASTSAPLDVENPPPDAVALALPVPDVVATPQDENNITGPSGVTPGFGFQAVLPAGVYERTVMPEPPLDQFFPPDVSLVAVTTDAFDADDVLLDTVAATASPMCIMAMTGTPIRPTFNLTRTQGTFDGWTVKLVDTVTGRRISSIKPLKGQASCVQLQTNHHRSDAVDGATLVVAPPDGMVAPSLVIVNRVGTIEADEQYPTLLKDVVLSGKVTDEDGNGVPATITMRSDDIYRASDMMTTTALSYVAHVETAPDGTYSIEVPRGHYDYAVVPKIPGFAKLVKTKFDVGPGFEDNASGRNLKLSRALLVTGSATLADGRPLAFADVDARPAAALLTSTTAPIPEAWPRAQTAHTDAHGRFALALDPGEVDIVVRPAQGTRFPWLVSPDRAIAADTELEALVVPAPVKATLVLKDPTQLISIPNAMVRAYATAANGTASGTSSGRLGAASMPLARIEIGRCLTDAAGACDLWLAGPP